MNIKKLFENIKKAQEENSSITDCDIDINDISNQP